MPILKLGFIIVEMQISPKCYICCVLKLIKEEPFIAVTFKNQLCSPGRVAQLVRTSSQYAKVVGSNHNQDTYKNKPMDA